MVETTPDRNTVKNDIWPEADLFFKPRTTEEGARGIGAVGLLDIERTLGGPVCAD